MPAKLKKTADRKWLARQLHEVAGIVAELSRGVTISLVDDEQAAVMQTRLLRLMPAVESLSDAGGLAIDSVAWPIREPRRPRTLKFERPA